MPSDMSNILGSLAMTCGVCPTKWEGTMRDGRVVYVRYRHDRLTWGFGRTIDQAVDHSLARDHVAHRQEDAGSMLDLEEMLELTGLQIDAETELHHAHLDEYWEEVLD